jgi:regulator of sigma D
MRLTVSDSQIDKIAQIAEKISAEENRRTRQSHTINNLLQERQQVLVSMCELAELESSEVPPVTVMHNLRSFNQRLVDYTALGHFEIYERIIDGKERRGNVRKVADRVYPAISGTTRLFVDFNDKYEGVDEPESLRPSARRWPSASSRKTCCCVKSATTWKAPARTCNNPTPALPDVAFAQIRAKIVQHSWSRNWTQPTLRSKLA